ncbi:MAG: hypothetical protein JRI23_36520, partial [Deltaproteobacteria bacterium]|nr:hypothetical protein [Deltaproteobacteria bacterium]MBW2537861.1 hypothetical protein [Deltaproteobacteria bacterium]
MPTSPNILDLTRDLTAAAQMGASVERVDGLLGEAIDILGALIPFDLATIMERHGDELRVRVARGALVSDQVSRHSLQLADFPAIRDLLQTDRFFF